jgi:hypothetical protein
MMTDFLGVSLIAPAAVEHTAAHLKAVVDHVHLVVQQPDSRPCGSLWNRAIPLLELTRRVAATMVRMPLAATGAIRVEAIDERSFGERPASGCR